MKLALVGVGNAGSRIVNRICHVESASGRNLSNGNNLIINSTRPAFDTAVRISEERRLLIGDVHREVDGEGLDGDPDLGATVAREERNEINRAFDAIDFNLVDGVIVAAGVAGGTGGGAGAVVIDHLQSISDGPVYGLAVLPHEAEGEARALAAARSIRSFVETADNVLVFDNDAWEAEGDAEVSGFDGANEALATRIVTLFAAGERDHPAGPENRMDPSDIMRTLDTGGLSAIGYAASAVRPSEGWLSRAWSSTLAGLLPWRRTDGDDEAQTNAAKINHLVRRATHSRLTVPCEVSSAERALIMLSGPARELSRKGFESGRYWLEQEADTVEVMAGDEPHDRSKKLTAVVLLSNVTDVPRIDALQEQAVAERAPSDGGIVFDKRSSD